MPDLLPPISEDDKMLSGLAYPLWPFIAPLVLYGSKKEEPFVHYNTLQGLALGVVSLGGFFGLGLIIWLIMVILPGRFYTVSGMLGLGLFFLFSFVLFLDFTLVLYLAWRVVSGTFLRLPFLGTWAEERMQRNLGITENDYSFRAEKARTSPEFTNFDYDKLISESGFDEEPRETWSNPNLTGTEMETDEGYEYSQDVSPAIDAYTNKPLEPSNFGTATKIDGGPKQSPGYHPAYKGRSADLPAEDFKPLANTLKPTSSPSQKVGARGFQWNENFSAPKSPSAAPKAAPPSSLKAPGEDFRPGLVPERKPKQAPRFQWDPLEPPK